MDDILRQDSIVLNLERACEQVFDMEQQVIRAKKLGLAKEYHDMFIILENAKIITNEFSENLQKMVGFCNIAIHEYTKLNIIIFKKIIIERMSDLLKFGENLIRLV